MPVFFLLWSQWRASVTRLTVVFCLNFLLFSPISVFVSGRKRVYICLSVFMYVRAFVYLLGVCVCVCVLVVRGAY